MKKCRHTKWMKGQQREVMSQTTFIPRFLRVKNMRVLNQKNNNQQRDYKSINRATQYTKLINKDQFLFLKHYRIYLSCTRSICTTKQGKIT